MEKKFAGALFLLILVTSAVLAIMGNTRAFSRALSSKNTTAKLQTALSEGFPGGDFLLKTQISLRYLGGNKEQNGVFIAKDALMKNMQPKTTEFADANVSSILEFIDQYQRNAYVMVIPTACAVQQSQLPYESVVPLYNQKQLIDDIYRRVSGYASGIDVYPILRNHQDEYIYYRTDHSTTGLGGYYIYKVAAQKLGLKPRALSEFEVKHLDYAFYGDLYEDSPYQEISPDRVSAYLYSKSWRGYTVTHHERNGSVRRYHTLYPEFRRELEGSMGVLLGGMSPMIDIQIDNPQYRNQLLIFGDRSIQSYLPFLLLHYARVTFVDTTTITPEQMEQIRPEKYNQVLFAYTADRFVEYDHLSVLSMLRPEEKL